MALGSLFEAQGYTGRATVGQLCDAWLESGKRWTDTTRTGHRYNLRAFCQQLGRLWTEGEPRLVQDTQEGEFLRLGRAMPVADLEPALVERAIDGLAQGRWNSVTGAVRTCLRWANRHGFAGVAVLVPAARTHKARPVTIAANEWAQAAHALYDAFEAADGRSRAAAAAALCSVRWGVRRGGVVRIEWTAVVGREIRLADKGRARLVMLDDLDLEILQCLREHQAEGERWVFPGSGETGRHVHPNTVTAHTRRVLDRCGLKLTLHQAGRHAAGTAILDLGGTPDDVAAHLGHVNDRVTRERYLPVITDTRRARALLSQAWAGGKGGKGR
ncbi:MAG: tyrosine-type recombinase/integrase [Myxococcales bacterium]|nr:tyrosine-type recombinase/integrase [Myxococcales bacterium]